MESLQLLPGDATLAEVEYEPTKFDLRQRGVVLMLFVVAMELGGGEEGDVGGRSKVDIMVYHEDWVYGGTGARE